MITTEQSAVVKLAEELIACPSVTPNDANCQQIIQKRLKQLGFDCENMRFGDVDNLWARIGDKGPLFVFAGHTDVVPTGPETAWQSPPFQPTIRDGFLFGRGAADMKGAIAAKVIAVENFLRVHPKFTGSIAFLITSDEEGPSIDGTARVMETLQQRGIKIDYCVIGEASSHQKVGDQVRVGRRGSLHGNLRIHGKQGHVANPEFAINPIHLSAPAFAELAQTVWDNGNEHYPPTSFQVSNIHSGTGAVNVIPGHLDALFNFRFSTAVTTDELKQRVELILKKHGLSFDLNWHVSALPFLTNRGKLITATQQAIKQVTQLDTRLSTGGGTSDGRFIAPTGAEVVELGTINATAHHIDECIALSDLENLAVMYQKIIEITLDANRN